MIAIIGLNCHSVLVKGALCKIVAKVGIATMLIIETVLLIAIFDIFMTIY